MIIFPLHEAGAPSHTVRMRGVSEASLPRIAKGEKKNEEGRINNQAALTTREICPSSPRHVFAKPQLPTLAERRVRAENLAASYGALQVKEKFAVDVDSPRICGHPALNSNRDVPSFRYRVDLVSPTKSPRMMIKRPSSSGCNFFDVKDSKREAGTVKYCTSSDDEGKTGVAWVPIGRGNTSGMSVAGRARETCVGILYANASRSCSSGGKDDAENVEHMISASVPSTPRQSTQSGMREPSIRVRRAFLRESDSCWADATHKPVVPHTPTNGLPPTRHMNAATSDMERGARQRSAGSSSGASCSNPTMHRHSGVEAEAQPPPNRRPQSAASDFSRTPSFSVHSLSHAATPRLSTSGHHAGAGTPCMWSPRVFVDVSDALKERCTSALTSTLRDLPDLNDKHKTQIMDSYCHEVCVALEDHDGLQCENIMICHQQERDARRLSLIAEHDQQQQILNAKLDQRRRDKKEKAAVVAASVAAAAVEAAAPGVTCALNDTEGSGAIRAPARCPPPPLGCMLASEDGQSDLDVNSLAGRPGYSCACGGERMESGECGECWALRFDVKSQNVAAVLNAACTLLLRQAAVLPDLGGRMDAEAHVWQHQTAAAHGVSQGGAPATRRPRPTMAARSDAVAGGAELSARGYVGTSGHSGGGVQRPATAVGGRATDAFLPEGWVVRTSRSTGKSFYYHTTSKKTQWLRP